MVIDNIADNWWESKGGFFGDLYAKADNSFEGFLNSPADLDARTKEEVEGVVKLCGLNEGDPIMDCPCGYGRHSIALTLAGFKVTGVDINNEHLAIAKRMANEVGADTLNIVTQDMRSLDKKEEFNAVINMFYSFGFFKDESDDVLSLQNFYNSLKPGGKFLMHTFITLPKIRRGDYKTHEIRTLKDNDKLELYREYNEETKREDGEWSILKTDGTKESLAPYSMRIYTDKEFIEMCDKVGFSKVDVYGDWAGEPYKDESELMIVVATK
jgi:SAM-dependent methyltransferase